MKLKPEDRTKAIVLVIAIVVVFGFVAWRFLAGSGDAAAPPTSATSSMVVPPIELGGAETKQALAGEVPIDQLDSRLGAPTPAEVDPFRKVVADATNEGSPSPAPGAPGQPMGSTPAPMPAFSMGVPPAEPALPTVHVLGVVVGGVNLAVLRVGDEVMFLREGDMLSPNARIVAILDSGVRIRIAKKDYMAAVASTLSLGPDGLLFP